MEGIQVMSQGRKPLGVAVTREVWQDLDLAINILRLLETKVDDEAQGLVDNSVIAKQHIVEHALMRYFHHFYASPKIQEIVRLVQKDYVTPDYKNEAEYERVLGPYISD